MKERIHISLESRLKKMIEESAKEKGMTISERISELIVQSDGIPQANILIASLRAQEKEINILKGMLNSFFQNMASLSEAKYYAPDTAPHPLLKGALEQEKLRTTDAIIKRRSQEGILNE